MSLNAKHPRAVLEGSKQVERRRSLRTRPADTNLKYDAKYHPADNVLRPASARSRRVALAPPFSRPAKRRRIDKPRSPSIADEEGRELLETSSQLINTTKQVEPSTRPSCENQPVSWSL